MSRLQAVAVVESGLQAIAGVVTGLQAVAGVESRQQAVAGVVWLHAVACSLDTSPAYPHLTSNLQQTKNETTNVVISISSCELLMMGIAVPETC